MLSNALYNQSIITQSHCGRVGEASQLKVHGSSGGAKHMPAIKIEN